jgi:hypothetical protein
MLPHIQLICLCLNLRLVFPEEVARSFIKRKRDISLGTWNVKSLYRVGSLTAAARELARYKLNLVGVQEVRWEIAK